MSPARPPGPAAQARLARLTGLVPTRSSSAARTPFVLLIVLLLAGGMLCLLILNASLNEGSFTLSELRQETRELTDEQQRLQAEVDAYSAPDALADRARELGMVPGGPPAFLAPDGTVLGNTDPTPAPPPPPPPDPEPEDDEGGESAEPEDSEDTEDAVASRTADATDGPPAGAASATGPAGEPATEAATRTAAEPAGETETAAPPATPVAPDDTAGHGGGDTP
ncbi:FtsB family cell division protein [Streptomyces sp. URMC 129]|uniref:FtsB family cell division protein n=1 Tax=Streptomyces sp. URMC 129 TaxID=3423407 RepID=UPI003F1BE5B9